MGALLLGSALAIAALAYVLMPLVRADAVVRGAAPSAPAQSDEASALEALREIEFDLATGKLSAEDYAALRAQYAPRAVAELKAREASAAVEGSGAVATLAPSAPGDDAAERMIARMKERGTRCPEHGARPEGDALYCSDCGRYLAASCLRCGAAVEDPQARFCGECGAGLAA